MESISSYKSGNVTGDVLYIMISMLNSVEFKYLMLSHKTGKVSALSGKLILSHFMSQVIYSALIKAWRLKYYVKYISINLRGYFNHTQRVNPTKRGVFVDNTISC